MGRRREKSELAILTIHSDQLISRYSDLLFPLSFVLWYFISRDVLYFDLALMLEDSKTSRTSVKNDDDVLSVTFFLLHADLQEKDPIPLHCASPQTCCRRKCYSIPLHLPYQYGLLCPMDFEVSYTLENEQQFWDGV